MSICLQISIGNFSIVLRTIVVHLSPSAEAEFPISVSFSMSEDQMSSSE